MPLLVLSVVSAIITPGVALSSGLHSARGSINRLEAEVDILPLTRKSHTNATVPFTAQAVGAIVTAMTMMSTKNLNCAALPKA